MLIGRFEGKITEKFQMAFPKKFREEIGDKIIITKGLENCLIVVSEKNWKTLLEGTEGRSFTNKSTRQVQRFLLGNASEVELDSKGRCVIPEFLREYAHIQTDIVFAGIERFVEIWDKKDWEEQQMTLSENIIDIAEKLGGEDSLPQGY